MHFTGLSFTDALEMKGVTKYFPDGDASVESLIAGNDMLCLPGDVALSMGKIFKAIKEKKLKWKDLNGRVKKVLTAKYQLGLSNWQPIDTAHLIEDLNKDVPELYRNVAKAGHHPGAPERPSLSRHHGKTGCLYRIRTDE